MHTDSKVLIDLGRFALFLCALRFSKKYPPQDCEEFFCDSNGGLRLVFGRQTQREIDFEVGKTPKIQTLISFLKMLITDRPIHFSSYANIQRVIF